MSYTFPPGTTRRRILRLTPAVAVPLVLVPAGCATTPSRASASGGSTIQVAAENFWGSLPHSWVAPM